MPAHDIAQDYYDHGIGMDSLVLPTKLGLTQADINFLRRYDGPAWTNLYHDMQEWLGCSL